MGARLDYCNISDEKDGGGKQIKREDNLMYISEVKLTGHGEWLIIK